MKFKNHMPEWVTMDAEIYAEVLAALRESMRNDALVDKLERHVAKFNVQQPSDARLQQITMLNALRRGAKRRRELLKNMQMKRYYNLIGALDCFKPIAVLGRSDRTNHVAVLTHDDKMEPFVYHVDVATVYTADEIPTDFIEFTVEGRWKGSFLKPDSRQELP